MISWDEAKRLANLRNHGIDFVGLEDFFEGDFLTAEDAREAYGEIRFQSIGLVKDVVIYVVWAPRGLNGNVPHIISARKATKHEAQKWIHRYKKH